MVWWLIQWKLNTVRRGPCGQEIMFIVSGILLFQNQSTIPNKPNWSSHTQQFWITSRKNTILPFFLNSIMSSFPLELVIKRKTLSLTNPHRYPLYNNQQSFLRLPHGGTVNHISQPTAYTGTGENSLFYQVHVFCHIGGGGGGISWNLSSLTFCHSLTSTVTFLILIGYEALSLTVAMVIVSEWQIVSDDKFHEMPPRSLY